MLFFPQYLFELLYPADATLAEVDLDMAGEFFVYHPMHDLFQPFELLEMFVFLFAHELTFHLDG